MDPAFIVAAVAGVAVLFLVLGVFGGRRVSPTARIDQIASAAVEARTASSDSSSAKPRGLRSVIFRSRTATGVDRVMTQRDWGTNLARELARADLALRPSEYLAVRAGAVLGALSITYVLGATVVPALGNAVALLAATALGWWLPRFWVKRRQGKRLKTFNNHLSDTIMLIANALRAGSSFLQAVEMVVRETQPPISTEFRRVIREVNLGLPFEQALNNMVRRVRSDDLELMATAINIQHQVGGNLAEVLDSIAFTIRERIRIEGEIRVLTAQQRLSGYVVGALPIFLIIVLSIIAPKFLEPMFAKPPELFGLPMGVIMLAMGAFMMFMGFIIIRRIVDIEV